MYRFEKYFARNALLPEKIHEPGMLAAIAVWWGWAVNEIRTWNGVAR